MTFFKSISVATLSIAVLAACGGGDTDTSTNSENSVEDPAVSETSSEDAVPVTAPEETETVAEVEAANPFEALPAPYQAADFDRGKRTFRLCQSCHTLPEGGVNLVGPNLYGVFGRQVGGVQGFTYSRAVQEADFVWTPELLDEWLASPRNFLPGNSMAFAGVGKPEDRVAVIAYIMSETGYSSE